MESVQAWIAKQRKRQERLVSLYYGLMCGRFNIYALFRLRYFAAVALLGVVTFAVEFVLLSHYLPANKLYSLFGFRLLSLFVVGGWWGVLEILRSRVRALYRDQQLQLVKQEIAHWLLLAGGLSTIVLLLFVGGILHILATHRELAVLYACYVFVIGYQIAGMILTRTLHASVYSLRRIYRPLWSLLLTPVVGLLVLAVSWRMLGLWSLPLSFFIEASLSMGVTLYYTRQMYHLVRVFPDKLPTGQEFGGFLQGLLSAELFAAGGAALLINSLPMFYFVIASQATHDVSHPIVLAAYLFGPLVSYSSDWARLFYFDLKRLQHLHLQRLIDKLLSCLWPYAVVIGVVLFITGLLEVCFLLPQLSILEVLPMAPLVIIGAMVAYQQIARFCDYHYIDVVISVLIMLVASVLAFALSYPWYIRLVLSAVCSIAAFGGLSWLRGVMITEKQHTPAQLSFFQWLYQLGNAKQLIRVYKVVPVSQLGVAEVKSFLARLPDRFYSCLLKPDLIYIYEQVAKNTQEGDAVIAQLGARLVGSLETSAESLDGLAALAELNEQWHLNDASVQSDVRTECLQWFAQNMSEGVVIDLQQLDKQLLTQQQCGEVMTGLKQFLRTPLAVNAFDQWYVSALLFDNQVELIFACPCNKVKTSSWHKWLQYLFRSQLLLHKLTSDNKP